MTKHLPTVISCYTKDTLYEKEALYLIESCKAFDLDYQVDGVPNLGSWEKNCCFKPTFIFNKLNELKQPLLWVDADAAFVAYPVLLETIDCDMAVWIDPNLDLNHPSKVISAAIYLNYTKESLELVEEWVVECEQKLKEASGEVWDQICLRDVIFHPNQSAKVFPLPQEYCMIYDKVKDHHSPVIMQYQASRLYKKFINNEVSVFWDLFPHEELRKVRENTTKPN